MSRFPEVITLLSSDEESPSTEDVRAISVKTEEPIKLKESARKSINIRKDIAVIKSSGSSTTEYSQSHNSKTPLNIFQISNSFPSLNHANVSISKVIDKKLPQTARKSIYSSQPSKNISSNNSNSKNIQNDQTHNKKTIISNDYQLQAVKDRTTHSEPPIKIINVESKGMLMTNKSLNNYKAASVFDKLKERGNSISLNLVHTSTSKSDKNNSREPNAKNNQIKTEKLIVKPQENSKLNNSSLINGMSKSVGKNIETLYSNINCNKNMHSSIKINKDVSLSWSKRKKLNANNESKAGTKPELSIHKILTVNGSKLENQSKPELCINRKLTTQTGSKLGSQLRHKLPTTKSIADDNHDPSKLAAIVISDPKTSVNENIDDFLSPEHIIVVTPDGTAYKEKSSNSDNMFCLSALEKTTSVNTRPSSNHNILSAKNKTASDVNILTKHASIPSCDADGALGIADLLRSEPMSVGEKVQEYLTNNCAAPETTGRQIKEVTSPKLSLKRKRQDESEILSTAKKGLFSSEMQKKSPAEHHVPNISISKEDPTPSSNNITVSSFCREATDLEVNRNDLPGPSHETSSVESNKQKFEMLIEFCLQSSAYSWEEKSRIRSVMLKKLDRTSEQFVSSLLFSNLIDTMFSNIRECPRKMSTYLSDLRRQLKIHRSVESEPVLEHDSTKQEITLKKPSQSSSVNSSERTELDLRIDNNIRSKNVTSKLSIEENQKKIDEKISQLHKHMKQLHKKIKKLQAKELSLDDLDNEYSTYILEDKYKRKLNEIYKYICKLQKCSSRVGFHMERRYSFEGTRYHEINQAVKDFINKQKKVEKFPSYVDIFNLVKSTNEELVLGIKESDYPVLAREIFVEVGTELKQRRLKDEEENFGCYLTDDVKLEEDPAERDEELKQKLTDSVIQGEQKLKELIEKYATQQEATGSEQEEAGEESDVSQEPKYNEDDDNLPSTNPATPVTGVVDEPNNGVPIRNIPVLTVDSDSGASTDPGCPIATSISNSDQGNRGTTFLNTVPIKSVDSDSSCDLPPVDYPFKGII